MVSVISARSSITFAGLQRVLGKGLSSTGNITLKQTMIMSLWYATPMMFRPIYLRYMPLRSVLRW